VNILPQVTFDMTGGQPVDPNMTRLEPVPMNVLPEVTYSMTEPAPALVLTLKLRPDATPAAVAVDVLLLHKALNEYELSLGGSGLVPDERRSGPTDDGKGVRVMLAATKADGAPGRLGRLAAAVNGSGGEMALPDGGLIGRSFEKCEAEVRTAA
jgi:hypothetical protein